MIVYNITVKIDHAIGDEWINWQKEIHIPEVMATGAFTGHRFYKLLDHDDDEGKIFVIQFFANSRQEYDTFIKQFSPILKNKALEKWGDKAVYFRTLLQNVE